MNLNWEEAMALADGVLLNAVRGISDLIQFRGYINVDFADVRTVMCGRSGMALMGTGFGTGENRVRDAVQQAISNPLMEEASINGAQGILINFTIPRKLGLKEIREGISLLNDAADPDAEIIYGTVINPDPECEEVRVTIIATGFPSRDAAQVSFHPRSAAQKMSYPPKPTTPVMSTFCGFSSPYESGHGTPSPLPPRQPSLPPVPVVSLPPRSAQPAGGTETTPVFSDLPTAAAPQDPWGETMELPLGLQMDSAQTEEERQLQVPTYLRRGQK